MDKLLKLNEPNIFASFQIPKVHVIFTNDQNCLVFQDTGNIQLFKNNWILLDQKRLKQKFTQYRLVDSLIKETGLIFILLQSDTIYHIIKITFNNSVILNIQETSIKKKIDILINSLPSKIIFLEALSLDENGCLQSIIIWDSFYQSHSILNDQQFDQILKSENSIILQQDLLNTIFLLLNHNNQFNNKKFSKFVISALDGQKINHFVFFQDKVILNSANLIIILLLKNDTLVVSKIIQIQDDQLKEIQLYQNNVILIMEKEIRISQINQNNELISINSFNKLINDSECCISNTFINQQIILQFGNGIIAIFKLSIQKYLNERIKRYQYKQQNRFNLKLEQKQNLQPSNLFSEDEQLFKHMKIYKGRFDQDEVFALIIKKSFLNCCLLLSSRIRNYTLFFKIWIKSPDPNFLNLKRLRICECFDGQYLKEEFIQCLVQHLPISQEIALKYTKYMNQSQYIKILEGLSLDLCVRLDVKTYKDQSEQELQFLKQSQLICQTDYTKIKERLVIFNQKGICINYSQYCSICKLNIINSQIIAFVECNHVYHSSCLLSVQCRECSLNISSQYQKVFYIKESQCKNLSL